MFPGVLFSSKKCLKYISFHNEFVSGVTEKIVKASIKKSNFILDFLPYFRCHIRHAQVVRRRVLRGRVSLSDRCLPFRVHRLPATAPPTVRRLRPDYNEIAGVVGHGTTQTFKITGTDPSVKGR